MGNIERDMMGNPVVYVVYDRSRSGWWRVATFKSAKNAQMFMDKRQDDNLVISCQSGSARDFGLAED